MKDFKQFSSVLNDINDKRETIQMQLQLAYKYITNVSVQKKTKKNNKQTNKQKTKTKQNKKNKAVDP